MRVRVLSLTLTLTHSPTYTHPLTTAGGLIKNAVLQALSFAVSRVKASQHTTPSSGPHDHSSSPDKHKDDEEIAREAEKMLASISLTETDLRDACKLQVHGRMRDQMFAQNDCVPAFGLSHLVVSPKEMQQLWTVVRFERAKKRLRAHAAISNSQTQTHKPSPSSSSSTTPPSPASPSTSERLTAATIKLQKGRDNNGGNAVALFGPHGVGKHTAAEALAFELRRSLKFLHCGSLLRAGSALMAYGSTKSRGAAAIETLFRDARNSDCVVVIEAAELFCAGTRQTALRSNAKAIVNEISKYPGVVVLLISADERRLRWEEISGALPQDLVHSLSFAIEMSYPRARERVQLWRRFMPADCDGDIDFDWLAREFAFVAVQIRHTILKAAAAATVREDEVTPSPGPNASTAVACITQQDLVEAASEERRKSVHQRSFDAVEASIFS